MRSPITRRVAAFIEVIVMPLLLLIPMRVAASWRPQVLLKSPDLWVASRSPQGTWLCLRTDEDGWHDVRMLNLKTHEIHQLELSLDTHLLPIDETYFASFKTASVNASTPTEPPRKLSIQIRRYDNLRVHCTIPILSDDAVQDWNVSADKRELRVLTGHTLYRFDWVTGKMLARQLWGEAGAERENSWWSEIYKLSPDATQIVGLTPKHRLVRYDARTGKRLKFGSHREVGEDILAVSFTSNPGIVQCNEAGETSYRCLADGKQLWHWEPDTILSTPNGKSAAAIRESGLEIRDLETGNLVSKRAALTDKETALVFSPDGATAYTTDGDGVLKRWRLK